MSFHYIVRQSAGFTVVDLSGQLTLSERIDSVHVLHELIHKLAQEGFKNILLNFRNVSQIDSCGIGELFGCLTTLQSQGGVLVLCNPTQRVLDVFRLTKLNSVIDVVHDESQAIQSFTKSAAV